MVLFLSLCGTIFQNTAIGKVGKALPDLPKDQVSELMAGTSSRAFQSLSQVEKSIVVTGITAAIRSIWLLFMVASAISFVFALPLAVSRKSRNVQFVSRF